MYDPHTFMDRAADVALAQKLHEREVEAEVESDATQAKAVKERGFEITTVEGHRANELRVEYLVAWAMNGRYLKIWKAH